MRFYKIMTALIIMVPLAASAGTVKINEELTLYKEPIFEYDKPGLEHDHCEGIFYLSGDKDNPDLRSDFDYYHCEGRYTLTLEGPKNKTITLFGGYNYGRGRGYLVIRKLDAEKIWLLDLQDFPSGQWVKVPSMVDMGIEYGAYEAFYLAAPQFDRNIESMKWGKWWEGDKP